MTRRNFDFRLVEALRPNSLNRPRFPISLQVTSVVIIARPPTLARHFCVPTRQPDAATHENWILYWRDDRINDDTVSIH